MGVHVHVCVCVCVCLCVIPKYFKQSTHKCQPNIVAVKTEQ